MKLYDYMKLSQRDYDVHDDVYCACVTCCWMEEDSKDNYEKFCIKLMKLVDVVDGSENGCEMTAKWSSLIDKHIDMFRKFSDEYWSVHYDDDDDFKYQWILEFDGYMAGYVSEDFYPTLVKLLEEIEQKENPLPYSFAQIEAAIKDRQACLDHLMTKDGNPKQGVRPDAIEANKIAVWAMQQVLELMVY